MNALILTVWIGEDRSFSGGNFHQNDVLGNVTKTSLLLADFKPKKAFPDEEDQDAASVYCQQILHDVIESAWLQVPGLHFKLQHT